MIENFTAIISSKSGFIIYFLVLLCIAISLKLYTYSIENEIQRYDMEIQEIKGSVVLI